MAHIFVIGGLIDFQKKGNQSIKHTVNGFIEKYKIMYFSILPHNHKNIDTLYQADCKKLIIHRLPKIFTSVYELISSSRSVSKKKATSTNNTKASEVVSYFENVKTSSHVIYFLVQIFYVIFEFIRITLALLRYGRPTFIYGVESYGALAASIIGVIYKIPVVKRYQGTPLVVKNGEIQDKFMLLPYYISLLLNKKKDLVVMANDGTRGDALLQHLGIPRDHYIFPMNGFDGNRMNSTQRGEYTDTKKIVVLSKLKVWKRVDRAVKLMEQVVAGCPNSELHIIGDGEMRSQLEELTADLGLSENVIFHGAIDHAEAMHILSTGEVFWSFYDVSNLGNPVIEAALMGKPIITLDDGSTSSLLEQKNFVPLRQLNKAAEITLEIFGNAELKAQYQSSSLRAATKIQSWKNRMILEQDSIDKWLMLE